MAQQKSMADIMAELGIRNRTSVGQVFNRRPTYLPEQAVDPYMPSGTPVDPGLFAPEDIPWLVKPQRPGDPMDTGPTGARYAYPGHIPAGKSQLLLSEGVQKTQPGLNRLLTQMYNTNLTGSYIPPGLDISFQSGVSAFKKGYNWIQKEATEPIAAAYTNLLSYMPEENYDDEESRFNYSMRNQNFGAVQTGGIDMLSMVRALPHVAGADNLHRFRGMKDYYLRQGLSQSDATVRAYRETPLNKGYKGTLEALVDPVGLAVEIAVPGGIFYNIARRGARGSLGASKELLQHLSRNMGPDEFRLVTGQEWTSHQIPDITGVGSARTIGQVLPGGAPYRRIEREMALALNRRSVVNTADPVTLVRKPLEELADDAPGLRHPTIQHATGIPTTRTVRNIVDDVPVVEREYPPILGKQVITYEMPRAIGVLRNGLNEGKRITLEPDDYMDLRDFLDRYGVSPWESGDEALGRFEVSPVYGDRQFIMGAFDHPHQRATGPYIRSRLGNGSRPLERYYITYSPETGQYGMQVGINEKRNLVNAASGRNVTDEIENVTREIDDQILRIEAEMANEPIVSPRYKHLIREKDALEQRKHARITQLEGLDMAPPPTPEVTATATVDEIESFFEEWNRLHSQVIRDPDSKWAARLPKGIVRSTQQSPNPHNPFDVVPATTQQYEGLRLGEHASTRRLQTSLADEMSSTQDIWDAWARSVYKIAEEAGLPRPPKPPGAAAARGATPGDSVGTLDEVLNEMPGSKNWERVFAKYEGTRGMAQAEMKEFRRKGYDLLKRLGLGQVYKGERVLTRAEGLEMLRVLHNGGPVPPEWRELFDHVDILRKKEQSEYIAWDGALEDIFKENPNYFPRLWIPSEELARRMPVRPDGTVNPFGLPQHLRPRADLNFDQMLELGYEPISYNIIDLMVHRRLAGIDHRETMLLLDRLKKGGMVRKRSEIPTGEEKLWRVPDNVGPTFDGIEVKSRNGRVFSMDRSYVPNDLAREIESQWGKLPTWKIPRQVPFIGTKDLLVGFRRTGSGLKRLLLSVSGFQHIDVGIMRPGAMAMLSSRVPVFNMNTVSLLPLYARVGAVSFFNNIPGLRKYYKGVQGITQRILDDIPMYDDFDITLRMIGDAGWGQRGDTSIVQKATAEAMNDLKAELRRRNVRQPGYKIALDRIGRLQGWWESNLFEGVYRETQIWMLERIIVPRLRKEFPLESAGDIAYRAADTVNMLTSSLGGWQTLAKHPFFKEFFRAVVFSSNETESWVRSATRMWKNPQKSLYRRYWIGYPIYLALLANVINMYSTGKPLPLRSYNPISLREDTEGSLMPGFDIGYNGRFMSPALPWKGREGQTLYLDIVGQADTVLRWMINAKEAAGSRMSPLVNTFRPFFYGQTWHGEKLDTLREKTQHAFLQHLPIGATQSLQWASENTDIGEEIQKVLPPAETGLGTSGRVIQAAGFNVRRAPIRELLNELARREGFEEDSFKWDGVDGVKNFLKDFFHEDLNDYHIMLEKLTPNQRDIVFQRKSNQDIVRELKHRQETGARREEPRATAQLKILEIEEDRYAQEEALEVALSESMQHVLSELAGTEGEGTAGVSFNRYSNNFWYDIFNSIKYEAINKRKVIDEVFKLYEKNEKPSMDKPNHRARFEYYEALEDSELDYGAIDWDKFESKIEQLKENTWTDAQIDHIESMTGEKDYSVKHPPWIAEQLTLKKKYSYYFTAEEDWMRSKGLSQEYDAYKRQSILGTTFQRDFLKKHPKFNTELDRIKAWKKAQYMDRGAEDYGANLGLSSAELAKVLFTFGYIELTTYVKVLRGQNTGR